MTDPFKLTETVLGEFFELREDGWHQARCDGEIERYRKAKDRAVAFWRSLSPDARLEIAKARRKALICATPQWLSDADKAEISAIYDQARRLTEATCIAHEVDHVVPLRGVDVCGLHVPWNLRSITAAENRHKGRSFTQ